MPAQVVDSLLALPKRKRLEIAERLWLSVADEATMPVSRAHREVVGARLKRYRAGESTPISHGELMHRLRQR